MPAPAAPAETAKSLWFESALLTQGWCDGVRLGLADGRVVRIETGVAAAADDERHGVALPGLANVHSHAFQRVMAGFTENRAADADDFWSWRDWMYRFIARLNPDHLQAIAALLYMEMLEAGFTRVGEFHYLHHAPDGSAYGNPIETGERMLAAAQESGIAITLLPVLYCQGGFGGTPPDAGQRRFLNHPDQFARIVELTRAAAGPLADAVVGIAPHSLRAVTPEQLRLALSLAAGGPIHIHAGEQQAEVSACLAWSGLRPVQWLLEQVGLDARWCVVHATHLDDAELQGLARSGAVTGLCPGTEANLGDGVFRAAEYLAQGGRFGIGSDSNVLISASEELRLLEYSQRLTQRRRNVLVPAAGGSTGRRLFEGAVLGGAQSLGVMAGLDVGAVADVVSLDLSHPVLRSRRHDAVLDSWIFAANSPVVDCVWRRGRKVVAQGRHLQREPIQLRYQRALAELLS